MKHLVRSCIFVIYCSRTLQALKYPLIVNISAERYQSSRSPFQSSNKELIQKYILCRYDSLTGVPSSQRTVAFEKASVLFNIGGLYTQIGTRQDRGTEAGLDAAVDNFLR